MLGARVHYIVRSRSCSFCYRTSCNSQLQLLNQCRFKFSTNHHRDCMEYTFREISEKIETELSGYATEIVSPCYQRSNVHHQSNTDCACHVSMYRMYHEFHGDILHEDSRSCYSNELAFTAILRLFVYSGSHCLYVQRNNDKNTDCAENDG